MLKRGFKIFMFILGSIVVLLISTQLFLTFYFSNYIKEEIQKEIATLSGSQYKFDVKKLRINLIPLSVKFTAVTIQPDFLKASSALTYHATFDEINLKNLSATDFLFNRNLVAFDLKVSNPSITIYRNPLITVKDTIEKNSGPKINPKIANKLILKKFILTNVKINLYSSFTDTIPTLSSSKNKIVFEDFTIDESARSGLPFRAEKFDINIKEFDYQFESGLYSMQASDFSASYSDSVVSFNDVSLLPLYSKKQFGIEKGEQTDRLKIKVQELNLKHINVKSFLESGNCSARVCELSKLNVMAYRDKNITRIEVPVYSPQDLIRKIPFYINIDSILIDSSFVAYEELAKGANKSGEITFNNINATVTGLTNDSLLTSGNRQVEINATALIMNSGKLKSRYSFPLNTTETRFECSAVIESFPLNSLNKMLKYNANLIIKEGVSDKLEFSFHANEKYSKGELTFQYHDLKIEILNKSTNKNNFKEKIKSFAINTFVLRSSNPRKNEPPIKGVIYYKRNPNRFIFNYTMKSVLSGLKSTLGL